MNHIINPKYLESVDAIEYNSRLYEQNLDTVWNPGSSKSEYEIATNNIAKLFPYYLSVGATTKSLIAYRGCSFKSQEKQKFAKVMQAALRTGYLTFDTITQWTTIEKQAIMYASKRGWQGGAYQLLLMMRVPAGIAISKSQYFSTVLGIPTERDVELILPPGKFSIDIIGAATPFVSYVPNTRYGINLQSHQKVVDNITDLLLNS